MSDNKGRPIGVWYSVLWARTFLRMNEDGTGRIDTPELDVYEGRMGTRLWTATAATESSRRRITSLSFSQRTPPAI